MKFSEFLIENKQIYYHGTSTAILSPDDVVKNNHMLKPPNITGKLQEKNRKKNLDRVFFTTDKNSAKIYAGRAVNRFGGNPVVYRVIPMGDIEQINDSSGTSVFHSKWAFIDLNLI